ncbi:hypothetical protein BG015_003694, partial [Linnemannia schmuckeri]
SFSNISNNSWRRKFLTISRNKSCSGFNSNCSINNKRQCNIHTRSQSTISSRTSGSSINSTNSCCSSAQSSFNFTFILSANSGTSLYWRNSPNTSATSLFWINSTNNSSRICNINKSLLSSNSSKRRSICSISSTNNSRRSFSWKTVRTTFSACTRLIANSNFKSISNSESSNNSKGSDRSVYSSNNINSSDLYCSEDTGRHQEFSTTTTMRIC